MKTSCDFDPAGDSDSVKCHEKIEIWNIFLLCLRLLSSREDILVELQDMGSQIDEFDNIQNGYAFEYAISNLNADKWKDLQNPKCQIESNWLLRTRIQEYADMSIVVYTKNPGPNGA